MDGQTLRDVRAIIVDECLNKKGETLKEELKGMMMAAEIIQKEINKIENKCDHEWKLIYKNHFQTTSLCKKCGETFVQLI